MERVPFYSHTGTYLFVLGPMVKQGNNSGPPGMRRFVSMTEVASEADLMQDADVEAIAEGDETSDNEYGEYDEDDEDEAESEDTPAVGKAAAQLSPSLEDDESCSVSGATSETGSVVLKEASAKFPTDLPRRVTWDASHVRRAASSDIMLSRVRRNYFSRLGLTRFGDPKMENTNNRRANSTSSI